MQFALNHMTVRRSSYAELLELAAGIGCVGVELRNDLGTSFFEGMPAENAAALAAEYGLRILALAEVKMFNDWSNTKETEVHNLMETAVTCGAESISLIPRNDGIRTSRNERIADLRVAMHGLMPLLDQFDLVGLIEPLGFETCGLRYKSEIVDEIEAIGGTDRFRLVHDTFHHTLAGGGSIFASHTGVVHISGVNNPELAVSEMQDWDRVLVDAQDRLGNISQISSLNSAGYSGPISFEAFSPIVHRIPDPQAELTRSIDFITSTLSNMAE